MFARIAASASNITGRIGLRAIRTSKAAKLVADASRSSTSSLKTAATPSFTLNPAHAPIPTSRISRVRVESNATLAGAQRCLFTVKKSDPLCLTSVSDTCETPSVKVKTPKAKVKKTTRWADEVPDSKTSPVSVLAEVKKVKKTASSEKSSEDNEKMVTTGASRDGSEEARVPKSDVLPMLALSTPSIQPIVTALRSQLEIVWKAI
ncbi:hypothetical protein SISNIDRAFT_549297 [Sistotremastrum niveocremeum HHB9708]|uniref:Uncharacterized protein n=1 Tax=Sistotremastrum niveocremeum HHB9708 TaxID=1314777 RepID=A0A164VDL7_9AGAM|nr:hypothetical protein SISNIDRAFT_549297 [Sistotremastrum niveocremeum HHB9708]